MESKSSRGRFGPTTRGRSEFLCREGFVPSRLLVLIEMGYEARLYYRDADSHGKRGRK
jgi:hypothetical protein